MANVATRRPMIPASMFSGNIDGGSSSGAVKRKTPSELRGEQLKRTKVLEQMDESPGLGFIRNANGVTSEPVIKPIFPKNPRYIDTRVDELFPSRKNSMRLKMLSVKENTKESINADHTDGLNYSSFSVKLASDRQPQCSGANDTHASTSNAQSCITAKKCSGSTFRSVMELSEGGDKSSGFSLNMDDAFKELAARPPLSASTSPTESFDGKTNSTSASFCSEFNISGRKTPLDFTLKTSMRVVASSSVNWFHRLMSCGAFNGSTAEISNTKALYSWVYPQSSLPPSVISALTLSSKGEGQMDFLTKRQLAWETSFRSLYVMLRKKICNLFYVCTGQFVAMFTINGPTGSKSVCNAYVSQSTRSLRSLLKEQDISFSMPLCHSEVEQVTTEDLFELSEIEKHNLGKTRRTVSPSDVDNSPESLLVFSDNNVHGLYDFMLNYRFLLPSLNTLDVPLLYSPVPFENAAVSAPEVKCKEVRKIDYLSALTTSEPNHGSASSSHYTIEIKDTYLPPWIISSVCDAIRSNGDNSYEASFVLEPISVGLNVGLDVVSDKLEGSHEQSCPFGVSDTVVSHHLSRGFLKGLKYSDDFYTVSLSPI